MVEYLDPRQWSCHRVSSYGPSLYCDVMAASAIAVAFGVADRSDRPNACHLRCASLQRYDFSHSNR